MTLRTITGTIVDAHGDPVSGAGVTFTMKDRTYLLDPDLTYLRSGVSGTTDDDGEFSVELVAGLPVLWSVSLPGDKFVVSIPEGATTTLEALRAEYNGGPPAIVRGSTPYRTVFNVKDYGAKGDGTTSDGAACNLAIDACEAAGGGEVYFPAGTYIIDVTLQPTARGVYMRGAGIGTTILKQVAGGTGIGGIIIFDDGNECGVSDMTIDGNLAAQDSQTKANNGISTQDVGRVRIERVESMNNDGYGVGIIGTGLADRHDLVVRDCFFHDNDTDGMDIKGGADAGADPYGYARVYIENVYSYDNGPSFNGSQSGGFDLRGVYVTINGCYAFGNTHPGFTIVGPALDDSGERYMNISNCYAFTNGSQTGSGDNAGFDISHGAYQAEGSSEFHMVNCHAQANMYGLYVRGAHVTASGCSFSNNRTAGVEIDYEQSSERGVTKLIGCEIRDNNINGSSDGVRTGGGGDRHLIMMGCEVEGSSRYGLRISAGCRATLIGNDFHNLVTAIRMEATKPFVMTGNQIRDCTTGISYSSSVAGYRQHNVMEGNTANFSGTPTTPTVASATSLALPHTTDYFIISGTTGITSLASSSAAAGRVVTLEFSGVLTVTDGSNLKLNGSLTTAADDTLTLCCIDGTNWYEIARSSQRLNAPILAAGSATAASWPKIVSGTVLTTPEAGAFEYDGIAHYLTNEDGRGVVVAEKWLRQAADFTGVADANAQPIFNQSTNGAITLTSSRVYAFRGKYRMECTDATSRTLRSLFGGTATIMDLHYALRWTNATSDGALGSTNDRWVTSASFVNMFTAAAAASYTNVEIEGTIRVNAGGTFIPQYVWSSAPASAGVTKKGSYFYIWEIGTGAFGTVGPWS